MNVQKTKWLDYDKDLLWNCLGLYSSKSYLKPMMAHQKV